MKQEDCFELGHITKVHGLDGFLTIFLDSDYPENYYEMESVLVEQNNELIPFFIIGHKESNHPQKIHILFEDIQSADQAKGLVGCKLYLPEEVLPELDGNKFYYHEVIGYDIEDKAEGLIGSIKHVFENTGNDFFALDYKGKEVLIPIEDAFIDRVDKINRKIVMALPEGLLDL